MSAEYEVREDLFEPYIHGNSFKMVDGLCPGCGKPLKKIDPNRFECTNPECDVIEVRASGCKPIKHPVMVVLAEILRDSLS